MSDKVFKLVGAGAAIGAAALAKQISEKGWKAVMASDPPANPEDPDTELWEAIAWAVASGAVIALARMLATRQWTKYYTKSTGHAPDNANDVS
ncbi:MAG: DUF4235 domain-containing protein [Austwickia sp.]|nr:DUF4235 domain-containing protein [Actinomycetota bacterium]MCB1253020.1 DUF4235 domain-containing protein [Austwickia sp.]MCO5308319.1 DUF4235 domain-containing protein [Austwickia sp.]